MTEPLSNAAQSSIPEPSGTESIEVSIVMPCLNEAETVGTCVQKAMKAFADAGINGEVIVADNGSTDGSIEIAEREKAVVVPVKRKGYGNALMGGIEAARGKFVIMGDADDSYDFLVAASFVEKLRDGAEIVQGCRLPSGGGTVRKGAMPWSHRWIGNPMLSMMARKMFNAPIHDIYCGMRGFTKELYKRLELRCTGMEFATEMIIKATLFSARFEEVPITLWPDGRKIQVPHLRTFRDGWRTVRFFLIYSPKWLFWYPGVALMLLGLIGYAVALPRTSIFGVNFDAHTLLVASMLFLLGFQAVAFAILTTAYAIVERFRPSSQRVDRFFRLFTLERGLVGGLGLILAGSVTIGTAVVSWWNTGFGDMDYAQTMRLVVPGTTLTILGANLFFSSFLCSMLGLDRK